MVPPDSCELCALSADSSDLITESAHWRTFLSYNQDRLGRCLTVLKNHKRSLLELTDEEVRDWLELLHKLHPAIYKAFGPTHINITCLMNGAFQEPVPHPHVHFWSIPRYDREVEVGGVVFTDSFYPTQTPETMDMLESERELSEEVKKEIVNKI